MLRASEALEVVDLQHKRETPSHELSGGQLRRLGLAEAIVHRPAQLLLDEPLAGLDPSQRLRFSRLLSGLSTDTDVIVSTHQTEELGTAYDHVAVIVDASLIFVGTPQEFLAKAKQGDGPQADRAYVHLVGDLDEMGEEG